MARNLSRRETVAILGELGLTALPPGCSAASSSSTTANLNLTADAKDATDTTKQANQAVRDTLDFNDKSESQNATRNLIAAPRRTGHQRQERQHGLVAESARFRGERRCVRHGQPQPVGNHAQQPCLRPVQGRRRYLPGARLRYGKPHPGQGKDRLDRLRHPHDH
jgi:hypothetical protein